MDRQKKVGKLKRNYLINKIESYFLICFAFCLFDFCFLDEPLAFCLFILNFIEV